jgi:hypothetical protein
MVDEVTMTTWAPYVPLRGPELEALERFFPSRTIWTGSIEANGMGPGSPPMEAVGASTSRWIMNGLWLECNCSQEQFAYGQYVHTWQLHLVVGWDAATQTYRAAMVDNNGFASLLSGTLEDDCLQMTLETTQGPGGQPIAFRFIWDAGVAGVITWRNESSVAGGPWQLIEHYRMTPVEAVD